MFKIKEHQRLYASMIFDIIFVVIVSLIVVIGYMRKREKKEPANEYVERHWPVSQPKQDYTYT